MEPLTNPQPKNGNNSASDVCRSNLSLTKYMRGENGFPAAAALWRSPLKSGAA